MDIQWFLANCKDVNHIVEFITKNILDELKEIYPEILSDEVSYLPDALSRIKDKTGHEVMSCFILVKNVKRHCLFDIIILIE